MGRHPWEESPDPDTGHAGPDGAGLHHTVVDEQTRLAGRHPAARHAAHHDRSGKPLVQMPEQEVGGERERIADQQARVRRGLLEAIAAEHASPRGADELHVEGLDRLGKRGEPHRHGWAALDLAVAAHHRLRDTADDPLWRGLHPKGLRCHLGGCSVITRGNEQGE
jgi:hypothetical protein